MEEILEDATRVPNQDLVVVPNMIVLTHTNVPAIPGPPAKGQEDSMVPATQERGQAIVVFLNNIANFLKYVDNLQPMNVSTSGEGLSVPAQLL